MRQIARTVSPAPASETFTYCEAARPEGAPGGRERVARSRDLSVPRGSVLAAAAILSCTFIYLESVIHA